MVDDDGSGGTGRIDFEADSSDSALVIAQGHARARSIELWEGAFLVGSLNKAGPELWQLS
ncbi:MAG: hypothetical protein DI569_10665 [Sphingopyxis macrogoltabida]|uniref:Uncharacterized protein n=1 Tax=Sphingopyxis macrogoltabida TaxID=33050 RepID=A0A2W5MPM3_SPHMC|nr:MAG: hypothetical protein DI569_10665 [Sphingopyxis macrogoltabida]